jgi:hypothetical protein
MTPVRNGKKDELIQLRVEKTFLDQLNAVAEDQHLPLSVMLRAWLAERLRQEEKRISASRLDWQISRFEDIQKHKDEFEPGPMLIAHACSNLDQSKINLDKIEQNMHSLAPAFYRTPLISRINQFGLEVERSQSDGKIVVKGQAFKSGQLEVVIAVPTEDEQIFGRALDRAIVETTQSLCNFLHSQKIELPYVVNFSLLNARGFALVASKGISSSTPLPRFSDDKIQLSEIVISNHEQHATEANTGEFIINVLDEMWNATGQKYSISFDNDKRWINKES